MVYISSSIVYILLIGSDVSVFTGLGKGIYTDSASMLHSASKQGTEDSCWSHASNYAIRMERNVQVLYT